MRAVFRRVRWTLLLIPILLVAQAAMLKTYDTQKEILMTDVDLPPLLGAALLGFRTVMADLMWLESDRYFHDGRYELALGALNMAALMDPKFVQAWALGGWHMIYNFKMVPEGFHFLRTGVQENKDDYLLYFETGYHYYFKLEEYSMALAFEKDAVRFPDRDLGEPHPSYVERMLAHCYDAVGGVRNWEKAIDVWSEVAKLEPGDTVPPTMIGKLKMKIEAQGLEEQGDIEGALALWERVIKEHQIDRNASERVEFLRKTLGLPIRPLDEDKDETIIVPESLLPPGATSGEAA